MSAEDHQQLSAPIPARYPDVLQPKETGVDQNILLLMACSGIFCIDGVWRYDPVPANDHYGLQEFTALQRSLFGPDTSPFFLPLEAPNEAEVRVRFKTFSQPAVRDLIKKYGGVDEEMGRRLAFMISGITTRLVKDCVGIEALMGDIPSKIEFVACLVDAIDEDKTGATRELDMKKPAAVEATLCAMATYVMSDGPLEITEKFLNDVIRMADAIRQDPIEPTQTRHLGLSQAVRLKTYLTGKRVRQDELLDALRVFPDAPVTGAEHHIAKEMADATMLQSAILMNMAQYHRGSSVQLSKFDRSCFEVRMAPGDFATTTALRDLLARMLPAIDESNFTLTLTRKGENFTWNQDSELLKGLIGLATLIYADNFTTLPKKMRHVVNKGHQFEKPYLGQADRLEDAQWNFGGHWGSDYGRSGQLGLPFGYGPRMFRQMAYYLPMFLSRPEEFGALRVGDMSIAGVRGLWHALSGDIPSHIPEVIQATNSIIAQDFGLRMAHTQGRRLAERLEVFREE